MNAMKHTNKTIARECIAMRVRRLNRVVTKIYDDYLRPLGLRTAQHDHFGGDLTDENPNPD